MSGLRIVRAAGVEDLVVHLAHQLATAPPQDPMARVEVAVPSRGMERWLTQRLAAELGATDRQAGVCANIAFPFPGALVARLLAAVLGDPPDRLDPWSPERLTWPVLAALEDLSADDVHAPLRAHLAEEPGASSRRRYPLARRIADLFDRYALYRPGMVGRWAAGADVDGEGRPLAAGVAWQASLWREVASRTDAPSPDQRFRAAIEALGGSGPPWPDGAAPAPVTVFGVLGLPAPHLDLLEALAQRAEVRIYTVAPGANWPTQGAVIAPRHRLLVSCGMAAVAAEAALAGRGPDPAIVGSSAEASPPVPVTGRDTALQVLQSDLRADRRRGGPGEAAPVTLASADRSVQVHATHGPMRQLEVLREVLYGLLQDDPTLEPRDIAVLTPDIGAFAPLVSAVFAAADPGRPDAGAGVPQVPFRVADRTVADENAAARALLDLLALVAERVTASRVLDLIGSAPLRARFGFSASDLATLPRWLRDTGVRWGIDADDRAASIGLADAAHTWQAGLDRLVLGVAMADDGDRMVEGVRPYDPIEGGAVELVARLVTVTDVLFDHLRALRAARPVPAWRTALDRVVDELLDPGPGPERDAELTWQLAALREALAGLVEHSRGSDGTPSTVPLTLEELRAALASHLGGRGSPAAYGTGAITFAGLEPLRNVPHRVVCLLGLDDGALPRPAPRHGFDLIASHPRTGDPDPRIEDRQLFLDAVLAARDTLVITYRGHDPRTNERQQPAVPVAELLDTLDASLTVAPGPGVSAEDAVRRRLVTLHPLQPYSARYFEPSDGRRDPGVRAEHGPGPGAGVPQAFDRRWLATARAAAAPAASPAPFLPADGRLPVPAEGTAPEVVELDDLARFLEHPVRHLLQRRLGLRLGDDDPRPGDRDPTELDGLQRWQLGEALLARHRDGDRHDGWRAHTLAGGTVPAGALGELALDDIERVVAAMWDTVAGPQESVPIDLAVPLPAASSHEGGHDRVTHRVVGSVDLVAGAVTHVGVSRLGDRHRIASWTRLLAVTAQLPHRAPSARLVGRDPGLAAGFREVGFGPLGGPPGGSAPLDTPPAAVTTTARGMALAHLGRLVELYLRGILEPVAVLPTVSRAYARARLDGHDHLAAAEAARGSWEGNRHVPGDQADAYVVQAFGDRYDIVDLAARPGFATDALDVWAPVVASEHGR